MAMLANLYKEEGKYAAAEPLYQQALNINDANLGPGSRQSVSLLTSYADLLRKMNDDAKAAEIDERIKAINKQ